MQNQVNLTFRYYHFLRNASKDLLDPGKISLLASATSNSGRGHINLQGPVRAALDFPALSELQHIEQMQKIHSTYAGAISNLANSLLTGLTKITFAANLHPDSIVIRDRMMLKAMYDQIAKLDKNNDMILGMDWVGYLNREVKPALISLNARYPASGIDFATLVPVIESLNRHITELNLVKFTVDCWAARLEVENFKKLVAVVYANWLDIATRLDQLDKAETYKYFLQAIADIGQLYGDVPTQNILNYINNNLVNHFIIDNDHNQVQLDVESLVSEFYNKFGDSNKTRGSLYLSVGANQAVSSNNGFVVKNDERTKIYNVTYVGEKIGFKLKFADRQRKWLESDFSSFSLNYYEENRAKSRLRSREKRYERFYSKPILTNVYALLFGSGLLYQVNFLNSEDAFKKPIVGLALGCSFYNDLDLNLSYTAVTDRRIFNNSGFFNLSFEVKFTEYLTRLSKKRRESKITSN
jgi:hypothetical protein